MILVFFLSSLGVAGYSQELIPNNNSPVVGFPKSVLRWQWCFLYTWYTISSGRVFLVGGCIILYPCSCRWLVRNLWPDVSRYRSHQRSILKDSNTSDKVTLIVMWRSFDFFVVTNCFHWIYAAKYYTRSVLSSCGSPYSKLPHMLVWLINFHCWYQFIEFLVAVSLDIPLVVSNMLIVKISGR